MEDASQPFLYIKKTARLLWWESGSLLKKESVNTLFVVRLDNEEFVAVKDEHINHSAAEFVHIEV